MKRRSFLQGLMAGAGVTALPVPIGAKPIAGVAVSANRMAAFHYGWACVFAQMNNGITPADVVEKFGVTPAQADALFQRMRLRGVLQAPGLDGRSHATRPWQPWDKRGPAATQSDKQTKTRESADQPNARDLFRQMIAHVTDHPSFGVVAA